jgi:hypothetical protein
MVLVDRYRSKIDIDWPLLSGNCSWLELREYCNCHLTTGCFASEKGTSIGGASENRNEGVVNNVLSSGVFCPAFVRPFAPCSSEKATQRNVASDSS